MPDPSARPTLGSRVRGGGGGGGGANRGHRVSIVFPAVGFPRTRPGVGVEGAKKPRAATMRRVRSRRGGGREPTTTTTTGRITRGRGEESQKNNKTKQKTRGLRRFFFALSPPSPTPSAVRICLLPARAPVAARSDPRTHERKQWSKQHSLSEYGGRGHAFAAGRSAGGVVIGREGSGPNASRATDSGTVDHLPAAETDPKNYYRLRRRRHVTAATATS